MVKNALVEKVMIDDNTATGVVYHDWLGNRTVATAGQANALDEHATVVMACPSRNACTVWCT